MENRELERFLAVVDHGSLVKAARHLKVTQQTLSSSLARLEKELEVRLFDRKPGGITLPTLYGKALVRHARSQLAAAHRTRQEMLNLKEGNIGTVTIGLGESFDGDIILDALLRFRKARPGIRVNLVEGYSDKLQHRLYDGEFDFIAAGVSAFELADGYTREVIYSLNDVVAVRPEHPLASRKTLKLSDLQDYSWLIPYSRPADLHQIVEAFVAEGLEPPRNFIGSDAYRIGLQLLLSSDLLIMVSPALVAFELSREPPVLKILNIKQPTVRRNASLIFSAERPITPAAELLLQEVREAAQRSKGSQAAGTG
jgi:DNA-binding transcriptional LysR family regulator